jgi:hypothetical protein
MDFFADLLIAAGAIGVAVFCFVLSRRLKALARLDNGIGGAIAVLSAQVDELTHALKAAQATARESASQLEGQTRRADAACRQLELLMASLHDLPPPQEAGDDRRACPPRPADDGETLGRPLARWNTNRLGGDARAETPSAAEPPAPASRARTFEPAEGPVKRSRSRVVRRRQGAEA